MAVIGGNNKSFLGRIAEIVGWFPALIGLAVLGGISILDANSLLPFDLPGWGKFLLNLYRGVRDHVVEASMGKTIPAAYADLAVGVIALFTMVSRKVLGFVASIGGFGVLAVAAWLLLRQFA